MSVEGINSRRWRSRFSTKADFVWEQRRMVSPPDAEQGEAKFLHCAGDRSA